MSITFSKTYDPPAGEHADYNGYSSFNDYALGQFYGAADFGPIKPADCNCSMGGMTNSEWKPWAAFALLGVGFLIWTRS